MASSKDNFAIRARVWMQVAISLLALVAGLYMVMSGGYSPADVAWATGMIGVVVGYWLR